MSDFIPESNSQEVDPYFLNLKYQQWANISSKEGNQYCYSNEDEISVVSRVVNVADFEAIGSISVGAKVRDNEKNEWIITARIPYSQFEDISRRKGILSLVASQPVRPYLENTQKWLGLIPPQIPENILQQGGEGVLVGVVDFGVDFRHSNFRNSNKTRLEFIWNQAGSSSPHSPFKYGRLYDESEINAALLTPDPYSTLKYHPGEGSHGTHVLDIAAGSGPAPGVAPKAKLAFVQLAGDPRLLNQKFGDAARVIEAVRYIFDRAGDRPCVVNLSLGSNSGPHDGTNEAERAFDAMLKEKPNRAIVIAAGNAYNSGTHKSGDLQLEKVVDLHWDIPFADPTDNSVEIWYSGSNIVEFEIIHPKATSGAIVQLGQSGPIMAPDGKNWFAFVCHHAKNSKNQDNVINVFQNPKADRSGGTWILRLHAKKIMGNRKFHAWIERDDYGQSTFKDADPQCTLGSLSTGHKSIVVASYDGTNSLAPIANSSSSGPTRDGRQKPEVSAPGHNVWAARSTSTDPIKDRISKSGTSMAAPAVTGLVARIFAQAILINQNLSIDDTLKIIKESCLGPAKNKEHDLRYGFGPINAPIALQHSSLTIATTAIPSEKINEPPSGAKKGSSGGESPSKSDVPLAKKESVGNKEPNHPAPANDSFSFNDLMKWLGRQTSCYSSPIIKAIPEIPAGSQVFKLDDVINSKK